MTSSSLIKEDALRIIGKRANLPVACLPLLAALTPAEHHVTLVDENVEPIDFDRVARAVPNIVVSDYFDRLALDRALDSIGDAERRLTAAMVGNGRAGAGAGAVEEWVRPRQAEVERIRSAIHEIAGSGLTLSKLSVAASLLGDLARH